MIWQNPVRQRWIRRSATAAEIGVSARDAGKLDVAVRFVRKSICSEHFQTPSAVRCSRTRQFGRPVIGRASMYEGAELMVFDAAIPDVGVQAKPDESSASNGLRITAS